MNFLKKYPKYKLFFVFSDFILIHSAFYISLKVNLFLNIDIKAAYSFNGLSEWLKFSPYSVIMIVYFQYANFYKLQHSLNLDKKCIKLIIKSIIQAICGYILYQFLVNDISITSRAYYIYFAVSLSVLLISTRMYLPGLLRGLPILKDNIVIIGASKTGTHMAKRFNQKFKSYNVVGIIDDHKDAEPIDSIPIIGTLKDVMDIGRRYKVKFFVLAFDNISRKRFFEIFQAFREQGLVLVVNADYLNIVHEKYDGLDIFYEFNLVGFFLNDRHSFLLYTKRFYDIILSSIGFLIFFPLFAVIAALIKLSSPGPVFYTHTRIGRNGKPFKFYKFRSMRMGSDCDKGREKDIRDFIKGNGSSLLDKDSTKVVNKDNITPIGSFLRKHSLDELPQLLNVLIGDMSMVGARPCLVSEWESYEDWQKLRLSILPGCTGLWQVTGRSSVNFEDSVILDIYYSQNFTPWWDMKLLLMTIPVLIFGKGGE